MAYTSPFHPFVDLMASPHPWLRPLRSAQLPVQDVPSIYAVDLAFHMATFFDWDGLDIKGLSRFRSNERWGREISIVNIAICLSHCLTLSKNPDALPRENQEYLRSTFNQFIPRLGDFAIPEEALHSDAAKWFLRATRLVLDCVERCGLRVKSSDPLIQSAQLVGNLTGSVAAVKSFDAFKEAIPTQDLLSPLYGSLPRPATAETPSLRESVQSAPVRPTPPTRATPPRRDNSESRDSPTTRRGSPTIFDFLTNAVDPAGTESAKNNFSEWKTYVLDVARLQRIPEPLIADLLPSESSADPTIYRLSQLDDELEKAMPGRRQWLATEGVRRSDFDKYWSAPAWVREFLIRLTRRNLELEMQNGGKIGESQSDAISRAAFFIPIYAISPAENGDNTLHLPIELFERARRHLIAVDDTQYCDYMLKNEFRLASQYVRQMIADGVL
jgi:hypothetical protein